MKGSESARVIAHDPDALGDAKILLARYPDVSTDERERLARFLKRGAPIDIGLLSSDPKLWDRAEGFKRDHSDYFKVGRRVYAGWVAALVLIGGALILIKDMGLN